MKDVSGLVESWVDPNVRNRVNQQVIGQVIGHLEGSVWLRVRAQVIGEVRGQVKDLVYRQVVRGRYLPQRDMKDVRVISNQVYDQVRDSMRGLFRRQAEVNAYRQVQVDVYMQVYRHTGREIYDQVHRQVVRAIWWM